MLFRSVFLYFLILALGWDTKNPDPVAKVVSFLLSDLSEMVTGEIIHADGGVHSIGGSMLPK